LVATDRLAAPSGKVEAVRVRTLTIAALVSIVGTVGGAQTAAQPGARANPPLVIESMYGRDLFDFYCAPCHGRDGRGGGPVSAALKTRPPDLTGIARRSGGVFPKARVEAFVTHGGTDVIPAHGTADMPVWGPTFRSLDPSDARVKVRIANLVSYLESIQTK
jgi:mono/diheme cytochrome c family protein